jgi:cation transport ATPase
VPAVMILAVLAFDALQSAENLDAIILDKTGTITRGEPSNEVIGGTLKKTGSFKFLATKVGKDTALANIIRMVKDAQGSKAPIQRVVDAALQRVCQPQHCRLVAALCHDIRHR